MKDILQLRYIGQCKYALTDDPPHLFCGEPTVAATDKEPYCAKHRKLCHNGVGKHPRSLEEMIYAIDDTVMRVRIKDEHTERADVEIRRAETEPEREGYGRAYVPRTGPASSVPKAGGWAVNRFLYGKGQREGRQTNERRPATRRV